MRRKVTVLSGDSECAQALARRNYADVVVDDYVELSGSDVVVAGDDSDWWQIRVRAPNAVILVTGDRDAACQATLFPPERVIATSAAGAALADQVEDVLFER